MAKKKQQPNKSQAIREYLAEHGDAKPGDIIHALARKGIAVEKQLVYQTKSAFRRSGGMVETKTGRPPKTAISEATVTVEQVNGHAPRKVFGTIIADGSSEDAIARLLQAMQSAAAAGAANAVVMEIDAETLKTIGNG